MATDDKAFLSRWARRKQAASSGAPEPDIEELEAEAARRAEEEEAARAEALSAEEERLAANRAAAEAIDLDEADDATDFTVFMKEGVPTALRQMALRKLWQVNPVFGALDGLNDYDHDYRVIHAALTKFESAWQVGKGYAKKSKEEIDRIIQAAEERAEEAERAAVREAEEMRAREAAETEAGEAVADPQSAGHAVHESIPDIANETIAPVGEERVGEEVEDEAPRRVPLRRRFALDDWQDG